MGQAEEETQSPLLEASVETQPPAAAAAATHLNKRTGTVWTASAHIITGVIGAGVLSLAWSVAQLGWVAGPAAMLLFAAITLVSTYLLSDCYRHPHPQHGPNRSTSYNQAVKFFLGDASQLLCALISQESLYGNGIAYTITAAASIHWSNLVNLIGFLRTIQLGTLWTCIAHIITAVIGAGVLSLTWSTAQLGWIAGPLCLLLFAIITYVSSFLLADCYRTFDTATRSRNRCYTDAVKLYLGRKRTWVCGLLQNISFYGTAIAYVITTSTSMRAIQKSNCYHREGHSAPCSYGDSFYMLIFGAVQIVMSQIPDFHNMEWLSIIAAIMSFTYAFIGFALGFAKVIENGSIKGSIIGVPTSSTADKLWLVFQAVGDIAFAYPYAIILLEIQDTLKSPPPENETMKKASMAAIFITTFFYLCCGCFGYAAFGNDAPGNLLTGFGFYEPYWLIDFANACIVLHLVGGYQIFSQPVFAFVEKWFTWKFPNSRFVNEVYTLKLPLLPGFQMNPLKLCFRTAYVVSTTGIAMIFPYFNQVLGVLGALNFWPLAIYFPVEMYFVQKKVGAWSRKWIVLRLFSLFCLIVSILALIGSVQGLITAKLG